MRWRSIAALCASALVTAGCAAEAPPDAGSPPSSPGGAGRNAHSGDDASSAPNMAVDTSAGLPAQSDGSATSTAAPTPARRVRRMTVDQWRRSLQVVTGGIGWTEDFGDGPVDMFEILGPSLGAPDYLLVTEENLEPSILIAKIEHDAALRVCAQWIEADRQRAPADRTFFHHADPASVDPNDVDATLRALLLRVLGLYVPGGDDARLVRYRALFEAASTGAPIGMEAFAGWYAVCVAMLSDPQFLLY